MEDDGAERGAGLSEKLLLSCYWIGKIAVAKCQVGEGHKGHVLREYHKSHEGHEGGPRRSEMIGRGSWDVNLNAAARTPAAAASKPVPWHKCMGHMDQG